MTLKSRFIAIVVALGNAVSPTWMAVGTINAANAVWTFMQGNVTIPAGVYLVQPMFGVSKSAVNGFTCFWGKPNMRRASGGELIVDGAITTSKLAANSVTAGTIAAGAISTTQLAAGAVTADKIAAGVITADKLAVGNGANYLVNSDAGAGTSGWSIIPNYGGGNTTVWYFSRRTDGYGAAGSGSFELSGAIPNAAVQNYGDFGPVKMDNPTQLQQFAVTPSKNYEFSGLYYAQGSKQLTFFIDWYDANNVHIDYAAVGVATMDMGGNPNYDLSKYRQFFMNAVSPANAVYCVLFIRNEGATATSGATNAYSWFTQLFFGRASVNQTAASKWAPGGVTLISGGQIVTNAITADKISANAITAGKIAAGAVTAGTIAAGAITAATIAAGTITGDKIAANTIGANQIAAGAITAKSLVLTDFSNIVDNGWQGGNLDGWGIQNLQAFYLDTTSGDAAGYVVQSLARDCCWSKSVAVTAGETYAFDVWVYNTDPNVANLYAAIYTGAGVLNIGSVASTTVKNSWIRLQGRYTIPSGYVKLGMLLQVDKTAGAGNSCYWSKPVMRRAASAELIVDGAITANKISVNSLDAITANLGAVNISRAIIGDLQVGTSNIAAGAVTKVDFAAPAGAAGINAGSGQVPVTGILAQHGYGSPSILIMSSFSLVNNGANPNGYLTLVEVWIWDSNNSGYTAVLPFSFYNATTFTHTYTFTPSPSLAATTFRFDVKPVSLPSQGAPPLLVNNRTINALTLKR